MVSVSYIFTVDLILIIIGVYWIEKLQKKKGQKLFIKMCTIQLVTEIRAYSKHKKWTELICCSVRDLASAVSSAPLSELSVDGNVACEQPECAPLLVSALPRLRLLNGTEVTAELRAVAAATSVAAAAPHTEQQDKNQARAVFTLGSWSVSTGPSMAGRTAS